MMKKKAFVYFILITCCFGFTSFITKFKEIEKGDENNFPLKLLIRNCYSLNELTGNLVQPIWFINTRHGLIFETPSPVKEKGISIPQGTGQYISKLYTYTCTSGEIGLNFQVIETNSTKYDRQEGLRGAITNSIANIHGENLKLLFKKSKNPGNLYSDGTFNIKNLNGLVKGYCLFKNKKIYLIIAVSPDTRDNINILNRIFSSINDKNVF